MRFAVLALAAIAASASAASLRRLADATGMVCHMYAPASDKSVRVLVSNGDWSANVTELAYKACKSYTYDDSLTGFFTFTVYDGDTVVGSPRDTLATGKPLTVLTTGTGSTALRAMSSGANIGSTASALDVYNTVQGSGNEGIKWKVATAGVETDPYALPEGSVASPGVDSDTPISSTITLLAGTSQLWSASGTGPGNDLRMSVVAHGKTGETSTTLEPSVSIFGDNFLGAAASVSASFAAVATLVAAVFAARR